MQVDTQPGVHVRSCAHCRETFTTCHKAQQHCSVRCRRASTSAPIQTK